MEEIELHPAHVWDCDKCGRENFCRSVAFEGSEEDWEEMRERFGVETPQPGEGTMYVTAPEEVECSHCGAQYKTRDYRADSP